MNQAGTGEFLVTTVLMCHAQEEIIRLNVEIHRFVTYLQDEDQYLCTCEEQLCTSHPTLAYQIRVLRNVRGRFNSSHLKHLVEITRLQGFTGTLEPGKSVNIDAGSPAGPITIAPPSFITTYLSLEVILQEDCPDDLNEEQEEEEASVECTVKSGSTPVRGPVKSGRKRTEDKGRGLDKRLVRPELVTAWIQRLRTTSVDPLRRFRSRRGDGDRDRDRQDQE